MASPPALLTDTYYQILNRGNNRENIFIEDRNYEYFLRLYAKYISPVAETFAYCLLRNHFHLLVRTKSQDEIDKLSKIPSPGSKKRNDTPSMRFSYFFNAYAKAMNKAYDRTGSLFQNPFKRVMITSDRQFWNVIAYIHQNSQKHHFVSDFREWRWSSYGDVFTHSPTIIDRELVLEWFGGLENYRDVHQKWVSDEDSRWFAEEDKD